MMLNMLTHVSLAKASTEEWKDLGPFTKKCNEAKDWRETHNPQVCFTSGAREQSNNPPTKKLKGLIDLGLLPDCLWAKDKYDVALIKSCEPIQITPKSDFRPKKPQYPVKAEAMLGITPVFNYLLERGIIVPCQSSPVNIPIFPVKKIRDKGQPTEWRFVQDLQAVNAAVEARAPNVPNSYTILAQIPPNTEWYTAIDISNAFFSVPVHPDSQFGLPSLLMGKDIRSPGCVRDTVKAQLYTIRHWGTV